MIRLRKCIAVGWDCIATWAARLVCEGHDTVKCIMIGRLVAGGKLCRDTRHCIVTARA